MKMPRIRDVTATRNVTEPGRFTRGERPPTARPTCVGTRAQRLARTFDVTESRRRLTLPPQEGLRSAHGAHDDTHADRTLLATLRSDREGAPSLRRDRAARTDAHRRVDRLPLLRAGAATRGRRDRAAARARRSAGGV